MEEEEEEEKDGDVNVCMVVFETTSHSGCITHIDAYRRIEWDPPVRREIDA
jgi:hypothetical protein